LFNAIVELGAFAFFLGFLAMCELYD
jgi:hypothetical protein